MCTFLCMIINESEGYEWQTHLQHSVSRQLNSTSACWEDLCLRKSACHCPAADRLCSSAAAPPKTSDSSLLTSRSLLSRSCTLWTLHLLHIQSGFNCSNPTFLPPPPPHPPGNRPIYNRTQCLVSSGLGARLLPLTHSVFLWVPGNLKLLFLSQSYFDHDPVRLSQA